MGDGREKSKCRRRNPLPSQASTDIFVRTIDSMTSIYWWNVRIERLVHPASSVNVSAVFCRKSKNGKNKWMLLAPDFCSSIECFFRFIPSRSTLGWCHFAYAFKTHDEGENRHSREIIIIIIHATALRATLPELAAVSSSFAAAIIVQTAITIFRCSA